LPFQEGSVHGHCGRTHIAEYGTLSSSRRLPHRRDSKAPGQATSSRVKYVSLSALSAADNKHTVQGPLGEGRRHLNTRASAGVDFISSCAQLEDFDGATYSWKSHIQYSPPSPKRKPYSSQALSRTSRQIRFFRAIQFVSCIERGALYKPSITRSVSRSDSHRRIRRIGRAPAWRESRQLAAAVESTRSSSCCPMARSRPLRPAQVCAKRVQCPACRRSPLGTRACNTPRPPRRLPNHHTPHIRGRSL
jgi:hypothetical protein